MENKVYIEAVIEIAKKVESEKEAVQEVKELVLSVLEKNITFADRKPELVRPYQLAVDKVSNVLCKWFFEWQDKSAFPQLNLLSNCLEAINPIVRDHEGFDTEKKQEVLAKLQDQFEKLAKLETA